MWPPPAVLNQGFSNSDTALVFQKADNILIGIICHQISRGRNDSPQPVRGLDGCLRCPPALLSASCSEKLFL